MVILVVLTTQVNVTSSPGHIPLDGPVNWLTVPEIVQNGRVAKELVQILYLKTTPRPRIQTTKVRYSSFNALDTINSSQRG